MLFASMTLVNIIKKKAPTRLGWLRPQVNALRYVCCALSEPDSFAPALSGNTRYIHSGIRVFATNKDTINGTQIDTAICCNITVKKLLSPMSKGKKITTVVSVALKMAVLTLSTPSMTAALPESPCVRCCKMLSQTTTELSISKPMAMIKPISVSIFKLKPMK